MTQHRAECEAYGVVFLLRSNCPKLLGLAMQTLPYGSQRRELDGGIDPSDIYDYVLIERERRYRLLRNGSLVTEQGNLTKVLHRLGRDLMVHIANFAPKFVFVHAGVVGWQGHALVLPGPSFAGKTTLVSALVRAGALYYSDEYAVVDEAGRVHPYARDLQVRRSGQSAQTSVPVAELGGLSGTGSLAATQIAFCEYTEGAQWSPEAISPGRAVLELLRHTIPVQRTPRRVMAVLTAMLDGASALRSSRGDAAEAAQKLLALCAMPAGLP